MDATTPTGYKSPSTTEELNHDYHRISEDTRLPPL